MVEERITDDMRTNPKCTPFLEMLKDADVTFANLECTLSKPIHEPDIAKDLALIGFDVVSLNHHSFEFGYVGLFNTMRALDDAHIKHVGAGKNLKEAMRTEIFELNGKKIGFLGFSSNFRAGTEAFVFKAGLASIHLIPSIDFEILAAYQNLPQVTVRIRVDEASTKIVTDRIRDAKKNVDFLVVGIHWGMSVKSLDEEVQEFQPSLAHAMIDAGADIIVGHHSHRTHGVEIYKDRPIFYSLGNLIFPTKSFEEAYGGDYHEQVFAQVKLVDGKLAELVFIPIWVPERALPSIGNTTTRDNMLQYLLHFEEIYKFGAKYAVQDEEIAIKVCLT